MIAVRTEPMADVQLITDPEDQRDESPVPITAIVRLKHAILRKLAKACGSQSEASRRLGVTPQEFGKWINLKGRPARTWSEERAVKFATTIFELTGHTVDEIWPDWLDECLGCATVGEQTRDFTATELKRLASPFEETLDLPPGASLTDELNGVLKTLTHREREIIRMRFGLDGESYELSECGDVFKVTKERIRQIEMKAIRKLQHHTRKDRLREFVRGVDDDAPVERDAVEQEPEIT